eukprot:2616186-Pyramimonas_sp.AAC.1
MGFKIQRNSLLKTQGRDALHPLSLVARPGEKSSPGVDCRPAMWQSAGREYTSNIRWNTRNEWCAEWFTPVVSTTVDC